ncbi:MAG: MCE family protein [Chitinivibrionales bacterium]|nr:MCE family protein [Chitinivibrionales bacterium]
MAQTERNLFDRRKIIAWSALKVGIIISLGILIFFSAVFFSGVASRLFTPRDEISALFENASGLRPGSPVWLLGVEIGTVENIKFSNGQTLITFSVNRNAFNYIHANAEAYIRTIGILGDKYVEINPGSREAPLVDPGQRIEGKEAVEFEDILQTSTQSIAEVQSFLSRLDSIVAYIEKGEGSIAKLIRNPEFYQELYSTVNSLSSILGNVQESEGTFKKLVESPALYNQFLATTSSLRKFSRSLNDTSSTINRLTQDPQLYANATEAFERVSMLIGRMENGDGLFGLGQTDTLVQDLRSTLRSINVLVTDVQENPKKYFDFSVF